MWKHLWVLIRPLQWLKNAFVFAGLIFSNRCDDLHLFLMVLTTFISFCLISSLVYILNDIIDIDYDRHHPQKRNRPLASHDVTIFQALALALLLLISGMAIGLLVSWRVVIILSAYILLNAAYSLYLKKIVLVDVFCISSGFMLRLFAGTTGVGIPPSKWLLLCGMMITLFFGFGKRRAELFMSSRRRKVLEKYSPIILEQILAICAASAIITYSLYTMSPETLKIHHTDNLIYTVPFVIYALFRYLFLIHHRYGGEDPSTDLVKDPHILFSVVCWTLLSLYLVKMN